jgi:ankyrin repeat protein
MDGKLRAARAVRDALFLEACWDGDPAIVAEGLGAGVDPNCCDQDGITGLMKAITRGQDEVPDPQVQM